MSLEDAIQSLSPVRAIDLDPAHQEAEIITHDLRGVPLLTEFVKVGTAGGGSGI